MIGMPNTEGGFGCVLTMHMTRPSQETHTTTHRYGSPLVMIFLECLLLITLRVYLQAPPPLCQFLKWIDLEQDPRHKEEIAYEEQRKWNYMFQLIREEEREKKDDLRKSTKKSSNP
jgi:hypothetical protein